MAGITWEHGIAELRSKGLSNPLKTLLRPDSSDPIRQRAVHGQVLAITGENRSPYLCNLTSDLCNVYNGLVPDVKPFRLTESVKAAG